MVALAGIAMACGGEPDLRCRRGSSLELCVAAPVKSERVAFSDGEGRHRVLRAQASNRQLAVVEVTIANRTSIVTPMLVDSEAAQLGDRRGERFDAVDAIASAAVVDSTGPDENKFMPLLWGPLVLERNFQATGWMVFDVPKGLTLGTIWWDEVDSISVDYVD
jgi:hypothetical protein